MPPRNPQPLTKEEFAREMKLFNEDWKSIHEHIEKNFEPHSTISGWGRKVADAQRHRIKAYKEGLKLGDGSLGMYLPTVKKFLADGKCDKDTIKAIEFRIQTLQKAYQALHKTADFHQTLQWILNELIAPPIQVVAEPNPKVLTNEFSEDHHGSIRWRERLPQTTDAIAKQEAIIGLLLFNTMLKNGWHSGYLHDRADFVIQSLSERFKLEGYETWPAHISTAKDLYDTFATTIRTKAWELVSIQPDPELQSKIEGRYRSGNGVLKSVTVLKTGACLTGMMRIEICATFAAQKLLEFCNKGGIGAFGGGYTVSRTVAHLRGSQIFKPNLTGIGLNHFSNLAHETYYQSPTGILYQLNSIVRMEHLKESPSPVLILPDQSKFPKEFQATCNRISRADFCLLSCNGPERREGHSEIDWYSGNFQFESSFRSAIIDHQERGGSPIAAEIVGHFFDKDGNEITDTATISARDAIATCVPLSRLKSMARGYGGNIIMVAVRGYKAKAVEIALNQGLINHLIIDESIANALIT